MIRREFLSSGALTVGALAVGGPLVLAPKSCGTTKQLAIWTDTVIGALRDVSPILTDMGATGIVAAVAKALPIAERLKKAFDDNDNASAQQFLEDLTNPSTGIFVDIAKQIGLLANDERKKLVLGFLAIGQVAIRLIMAKIQIDVPASIATAARKSQPATAAMVDKYTDAETFDKLFQASRF